MSVHYAIKGYFDKEKDHMLLMRNVAMFTSPRSSQEFNKGWPAPVEEKESNVVDMSLPENQEWYRKMKQKHNIK